MHGNKGVLSHNRHPISFLFLPRDPRTGALQARDLHIIAHRVLERRKAYEDEDFEMAPAAEPDHELNLTAADQLLAAIGGR